MKVHLIALLWLCGFFIAGSTNPYMPFANLIGAFVFGLVAIIINQLSE